MLKKFLREVVIIAVGKQAEEIADLLDSKKHVNEFILAKKLDITINQTRNILYKLSDHGLVSSIRKKDKRKGWYTYFWKIEVLKALEFLRDILAKRVDQIEHQVKSRETKMFYVCEKCHIECTEENALLNSFTCNECGEVFTVKDNSKILKEMKKSLDKFQKEIGFIDEEIQKEKERLDKVKQKELKKEAEEKAAKRAAKRLANAKLKKKLMKGKSRSGSPKLKSKGRKPVKKIMKKKIKPKKKIVKKKSKKIVKKKVKANPKNKIVKKAKPRKKSGRSASTKLQNKGGKKSKRK